MAKYRKKSLVVEAWQWKTLTGIDGSIQPIPPAPHNMLRVRRKYFLFGKKVWQLKTLEGWYDLTPGDYIIRGIKGEYYPCKPDIFKLTYDIVD